MSLATPNTPRCDGCETQGNAERLWLRFQLYKGWGKHVASVSWVCFLFCSCLRFLGMFWDVLSHWVPRIWLTWRTRHCKMPDVARRFGNLGVGIFGLPMSIPCSFQPLLVGIGIGAPEVPKEHKPHKPCRSIEFVWHIFCVDTFRMYIIYR